VGKIGFIFPGQASQYVGMGKDLYDAVPLVKTMYQTANDILGVDIAKISFDGPEEKLKQTVVTQPAIFALSAIISRLLCEKNVLPDAVAGHSLGEYPALVAAGVIDFEAALTVVKRRAELMQIAGQENPGSMAAIINLSQTDVEQICQAAQDAGIVQAANFNSPQQVVISGSVAGVNKAMQLAQEKGALKVIPLQVSGAFHSPLMLSAQVGLEATLKDVKFLKAKVPVYANVTAKPTVEPDTIKELLIKQITAPVRWTELIQNMIQDGVEQFYEVGPRNVLSGLIKRIDRRIKTTTIGNLNELNAIIQ
jgi:[acyl-carrier-protein] S-malonyltransferase